MYNYVRAVALSRTIGAQWEQIDLNEQIVYDIFSKYSQVCLELSNSFLTGNVFVHMDSLKEHYLAYSGTLSQLLIELADTTLPYIDKLPNTAIKYAKYSDAVQSGYKLDICKIGYAHITNEPDSSLPDVAIARTNYDTDMSLLHSHCLLSVNGFYHSTDTDGVLAYVKDGGETLRKSNMNHVGILSFLDIGKLTKIAIDPTKVSAGDTNGYLKDKVYIDLNTSLIGKSYFLVLGGYLVFPKENILWARSDTTIALQLSMLPYLERIYESNNYLNIFNKLNLTVDVNNPDKINTVELYSNEVILKYLTLSQSYIVIVDSPNLTTRNLSIRSSNMPGVFTCYQDPTCPLLVGYGRTSEYWKIKDGTKWLVKNKDSYTRNYLLDSKHVNNTSQLNSQRPFDYSRGSLLEIAGYI